MIRGGIGKWFAIIFVITTITLSCLFGGSPALAAPENPNPNTPPAATTTTKPNSPNAPNNQDQENGEGKPASEKGSCEANLKGFGWLFCPGQSLISSLIDTLMGWIADSLQWTVLADNQSVDIREIWQKFLVLANIVFAIGFIALIYSMATSTVLSSYTLKKFLPRLIIIAVLVNLSFYVCAALVDLSNIAGKGIYSLIMQQSISDVKAWPANIGNTIASTAGILIAMFVFGGSAAIALLVILVVIAFRQFVLLLLVIASPVIAALYLMPNTEKWGKKLSDWFIKLLIVYPMFTAVWGASRLAANIFATTGTTHIPGFIISFLCSIAPALAILPIFKASGGLMAAATNAVSRSGAAQKSAKAINSLGRQSLSDSRAAAGLRSFASNSAFAAQNKFGNKPIIGRALRSRNMNNLANYATLDAAKRDEAALEAGSNWAKNALTYKQSMEIFETGGTYTINGRKITLTDQHKIRGAIDSVKKSASYESWNKAIRNYDGVNRRLQSQGRGIEADAIRDTYASAAFSEKSPFTPRDVGMWQSGKYDNNIDEFLANTPVNFVNSISPDNFANLNSAQQTSVLKQLSDVDTALVDHKEYNKAVKSIDTAIEKVKNNPQLNTKLNDEGQQLIEDFGKFKLRNAEEQQIAFTFHIDELVANYNMPADKNGYQASRSEAYAKALKIQGNSADFVNMSHDDQKKINEIVANGLGASYAPVAIASWSK